MEVKSTLKVGALVILALVMFYVLYSYFAHLGTGTYTLRVAFQDTRGLSNRGGVRMDGVRIGEVKEVILDTRKTPFQPIIVLSIRDEYNIPANSRFTITSGLLISNPGLEIVPGNGPLLPHNYDKIIPGEAGKGGLAGISPEFADTVGKLNKTFDTITVQFKSSSKKIDRILDQTHDLLTTTNKIALSANGIIGSPKLKNSVLTSADNIKKITENARQTEDKISRDLSEMVKSGKGKFDKLTDELFDLLTKVGIAVDEAKNVVAKLTEEVTDPRLQQSLQDVVELARSTVARFNQVASDIHQLTGDPQLQNNIKDIVDRARVTVAEGEKTVEKINTVVNKVVGPSGQVNKPHFPKVTFLLNGSEAVNPGRFRADADVRFGIGGKNMMDIGAFDIGQDTGFNLQVGQQLNDAVLFRAGLYDSKLGVGLEWQPSSFLGFRGDFYDTVHPRLDARVLFGVNKDFSIWAGTDGLFEKTVPLIGIQYKH